MKKQFLGKIVKIDFLNKQIKILFDDEKEAWYAFSDMDQIEHAYAITVHKAQGSEFDVVIMVVTQSSAMLLTRNLLYTGLTRAKKLLILIGNEDIIKSKIQLSRCRQEILFSSIRTRKYCILRMKPIRGSMHGLVLPEVTPQ